MFEQKALYQLGHLLSSKMLITRLDQQVKGMNGVLGVKDMRKKEINGNKDKILAKQSLKGAWSKPQSCKVSGLS